MRISIVLLALLLIGGCNFMTQQSDDPGAEGSKKADVHNARNSLDFYGTYKGVMPCGDCEGIETEIRLNPESFFARSIRYLGNDDPRRYFMNGDFEWDDEGNIITLLGIDPPNQFFVAENKLIHLDADGQQIKGELAERYTLIKEQ